VTALRRTGLFMPAVTLRSRALACQRPGPGPVPDGLDVGSWSCFWLHDRHHATLQRSDERGRHGTRRSPLRDRSFIIQSDYEIGSPWGLDAWVMMPPLYNPAWSWGRRPGA